MGFRIGLELLHGIELFIAVKLTKVRERARVSERGQDGIIFGLKFVFNLSLEFR